MKLIGLAAISILLVLAGAWIYLRTATNGFSAREKPTAIERILARTARQAAVPANAKSLTNPIPFTPDLLTAAKAHWADHCASCHSNDGSGDTEMGRHLYPPAPDMRQSNTQNLTDGELFYVIENGVRLTGMPAWGGPGHSPNDSWQLVHFIRHLPKLTEDEALEMQKLNPRTPAEFEEEQAEERFLRGETDDVPHHAHH